MLSVSMPNSVMLNVINNPYMLSVVFAQCRYTEYRYAECYYTECRYSECCGTLLTTKIYLKKS